MTDGWQIPKHGNIEINNESETRYLDRGTTRTIDVK
jgi:hypothetical protein